MPRLLRSNTIQLIESGIEMYIVGLNTFLCPSLRDNKFTLTKMTPVIGLMGVAVELLVKACVVQAFGYEYMYKDNNIKNGVYKFGSEIMEDFIKNIRDEKEEFQFIFKDIIKKKEQLIDIIRKFKLLQDSRAKSLHAGLGHAEDITLYIIQTVYKFIEILRECRRFKSYLEYIPKPPSSAIDREAILEDLSRRIKTAKNVNTQMNLLKDMYLVLPYCPDYKPEWIEGFEEHFSVVVPKKQDVTYLVKALTDAHSIYLLRNRGGKEGIPVRIEMNNPDALPIAIHNFKRELSTIPEQFNNDCQDANTRYKTGLLSLPIDDFNVDLYGLGLYYSKILHDSINKLTAQQAWAFIATALQTRGRPRPFWFFVQACDELKKLIEILMKIKSFSNVNAYYCKRVDYVIAGINAIIENQEISINDIFDRVYDKPKNVDTFVKSAQKSIDRKDVLITSENIQNIELSENVKKELLFLLKEENSIGQTLEAILCNKHLTPEDLKICTILFNNCYKYNDRNGLIKVLRSDQMKKHSSQARQRILYQDYIVNGPKIIGVDKNIFF